MRFWLLLAVCGSLAGACGGQVSGSEDAGSDGHASSGSSGAAASSGSGGGGSGGGSGGDVPLCPPDPPGVGVSCVSPGQGCAYLLGGVCQGYRCSSSSGWKADPTVTCP